MNIDRYEYADITKELQ